MYIRTLGMVHQVAHLLVIRSRDTSKASTSRDRIRTVGKDRPRAKQHAEGREFGVWSLGDYRGTSLIRHHPRVVKRDFPAIPRTLRPRRTVGKDRPCAKQPRRGAIAGFQRASAHIKGIEKHDFITLSRAARAEPLPRSDR